MKRVWVLKKRKKKKSKQPSMRSFRFFINGWVLNFGRINSWWDLACLLKLVGNLRKPIKISYVSSIIKITFFFFLKKHLLFYFTILACILLFTYSPYFKLMIFYDLNHQIKSGLWQICYDMHSFQLRMALQNY